MQTPGRLVTRYQCLLQLLMFLLILSSFDILKQCVFGFVSLFPSPSPNNFVLPISGDSRFVGPHHAAS